LYYLALEEAQKSNEITQWINYFVETTLQAQRQSRVLIDLTLSKTKFYDRFKDQLSERQLKVIKRMLEEEPKGFEGGMTTKKYMSITKASKATATRDLQVLADLKILIVQGGGRSTHYTLNLKVQADV
jgi:Fic family protein